MYKTMYCFALWLYCFAPWLSGLFPAVRMHKSGRCAGPGSLFYTFIQRGSYAAPCKRAA